MGFSKRIEFGPKVKVVQYVDVTWRRFSIEVNIDKHGLQAWFIDRAKVRNHDHKLFAGVAFIDHTLRAKFGPINEGEVMAPLFIHHKQGA